MATSSSRSSTSVSGGAHPNAVVAGRCVQPKAERSFKPLLPPYLRELHDKGEISDEVFTKVERGNAIRELGL